MIFVKILDEYLRSYLLEERMCQLLLTSNTPFLNADGWLTFLAETVALAFPNFSKRLLNDDLQENITFHMT